MINRYDQPVYRADLLSRFYYGISLRVTSFWSSMVTKLKNFKLRNPKKNLEPKNSENTVLFDQMLAHSSNLNLELLF